MVTDRRKDVSHDFDRYDRAAPRSAECLTAKGFGLGEILGFLAGRSPGKKWGMAMNEDPNAALKNYDRFIQRVAVTGIVWGLSSKTQEWATSPSNEFEDTEVILFWSERGEAMAHAKEEWAGYVPTEIGFDDFIDAWLQGMDEDDVLAGPNWDTDMAGLEIEATDLADRLLMERE